MSRIILLALLSVGLAAAEIAELERMARSIESLPALHDGRVKPLASVARHCVLSLSGRSRVPAGAASLSASAWLVESLADPKTATGRPAIRLRNPEVAEALGLAERPGMRFSVDEVIAGLRANRSQLEALFHRPRENLAPAETQLIELSDNLARVFNLVGGATLAVIPGPEAHRERWLPISEVQDPDPLQTLVLSGWIELLSAVTKSDVQAVERCATALAGVLAQTGQTGRLSAEVAYHRLGLLDWSLALDLLCLVLLGASALLGRRWLWAAAIASLAAGTICLLVGMGLRMWIMQRPPVATLYESVIFVGAVSALLGLAIEAFRRRGDGALVGAVLAAALLLVGRSYADDGDTMGMLAAVLNSNFWLTIHVLTITAGYGCTLVAGVVAHVALATRALRPADKDTHSQHDRAMLILSLISLLFTLFGTILGGIWADQSWGRFWGWDPKENGALLIVLWLLMLLHLRSAGTAGPRAFALGLVIGNIVVAVAWFGVNLLGIGLHSYGFANGTFWSLVGVAAGETVAGLALWLWATSRQQPAPAPAPTPAG
jgi:ABC-type transport system involved in cytochrome c biogenesis permease subunit